MPAARRLLPVCLLAALLAACSALPDFQALLTPLPTGLPLPGDPQVTIQFILTATASGWTAAPPSGTPLPTGTPSPSPDASPTPATQASPTATLYPTFTPIPIQLPINIGPFNYPNDVNPLTGFKVDDLSLLERRPLIIKITNYPRRVRPQSGITLADLIFEYYIETGLTRFIAVFYGNNADRVGPIRSGRFFDEHIVRMYNGIFAFASADERVLETWLESDLITRLVLPRPDNCPPLCRDPNNPDYNNLYTNTADLAPYAVANGADNNRYDLTGMRFQDLLPWGGAPALDVYVRYSRLDYNHWQYNPTTGRYQRFQDSEDDNGQGEQYAAHYDGLTGQPVTAANVIVLVVPHEEFIHSSDTEVFKINLIGAGQAFIFRDGQAYEATWLRVDTDSPLQFFRAGAAAGTHFPLKPGNTFFQVVGLTTTISLEGEIWRFVFGIP
jgi:hypothetical protein